MELLAQLARKPSFTLAVAGCFRGVILHIVAAMTGPEDSGRPAGAEERRLHRIRAALVGTALIRMLDITPHARRCVVMNSSIYSPD